jgi:hypothetical protein
MTAVTLSRTHSSLSRGRSVQLALMAQRQSAEPVPAETPRAPVALGVPASPHRALELQRTAGNRATTRVLARFLGGMSGLLEDAKFESAKQSVVKGIGAHQAAAGQFLMSPAIGDALEEEFARLAGATGGAAGDSAKILGLWNAFKDSLYAGQFKPADVLRKELAKAVSDATSAKARALVPFMGTDADSGYGAAAVVWQKHWRSKAATPDTAKFITVAHLFAFFRWESQACKATTHEAARRMAASKVLGGTRSPSTAIGETSLTVASHRDVKIAKDGTGLGDILTYRDDLGAIVARMKTAIEDGWAIHVRVLSGSGGKDEEHSVLVVGRHADTFFFFDSDIGGSDMANLGYGRLYYDAKANRLSTAKDDADIRVYARTDEASDQTEGYHVHATGHRHRYQPMRIWTE